MPTVFLPHGAGPWPVLSLPMFGFEDGASSELASHMRALSKLPPAPPRALLVVSAHWEEKVPTVNSGPAPPMFFDYGRFSDEAFQLNWPAPGDPALAQQVSELLNAAGIETELDAERGYDHGVFVPLLLAYPNADIPTVQLSLASSLSAALHLSIGAALAPLRDQGVFVVGSGNSFHNTEGFRTAEPRLAESAQDFDRWLVETVALDQASRNKKLAHWREAPGASDAHPREEHLIPLMVAAGAAGADRGRRIWQGTMRDMCVSSIAFG